MKKEFVREYNCSDPDLLQAAEIIAFVLPEDITSFTAFDSTITTTYPDDLAACITRAKAVPTDAIVVQQQAEHTELLNAAHKDCVKSFHDIAYFVEKAFENDPAKQKGLGMHEYSKAVRVQTKFIDFMEHFAVKAMESKAALVAVGCSMEMLTDAGKNATMLKDAHKVQRSYKGTRNSITQERITKLNDLFHMLKPLEDVARNIFVDDPARMAKYILPHTEPPKPDNPDGDTPEQPPPPQP